MDTNKKFTLPHPNNSTLTFQKKITTPRPPPQKKNQLSKKSTPLPHKKNLPNLHDLELFLKNCTCSLSTL